MNERSKPGRPCPAGLPGTEPLWRRCRPATLVSFRYVIRCGRVAASPRCCLRHSSYSVKFLSKNVTLLSPSKARMWVAIRLRNQRSGEITTAQPANRSSAFSRAQWVAGTHLAELKKPGLVRLGTYLAPHLPDSGFGHAFSLASSDGSRVNCDDVAATRHASRPVRDCRPAGRGWNGRGVPRP